MKYPCNMIKDLLPLYVDGVCSKESKEIVEQHLSECPDCKAYLASMSESELVAPLSANQNREKQKEQSFRAVKKKLRLKQQLAMLLSAAILIIAFFSALAVLGSYEKTVTYEDNISVAMVDGNLVGRLTGSYPSLFHVKRVYAEENGKTFCYLFFSVRDTKLSELTTKRDVFSEFILCPADSAAEEVDAVYYYTGDDTGIEMRNAEELQEIIDASVLLWSK